MARDERRARRGLRPVGAVQRRLRRWLEGNPTAPEIALSREDVDDLLRDLAHAEGTAAEYRTRLELALQAHAGGGPKALAAALGLAPWDRRAKLSAEETGNALAIYWYAYKAAVEQYEGRRDRRYRASAQAAKQAAHDLRREYPGVWPSDGALREWLRRALDTLADPESELSKTFIGRVLREQLLALPIPSLEQTKKPGRKTADRVP